MPNAGCLMRNCYGRRRNEDLFGCNSLQRASNRFPVFPPLPQVIVAAVALSLAWVLFESWQLLSEFVVAAMIYLNSFKTQSFFENFNSTFLKC